MLSRFHGIPERTDRQTDGQTIAIYNVRECADCWRAIKLSSFTLWLCNSATATRIVTCTVKHYTNQNWANISDDKIELKKDNAASVILPYPRQRWMRSHPPQPPWIHHCPDPQPEAYQHQKWTISEASTFTDVYKVSSTLIYALCCEQSVTQTHTHAGKHNTFSSSIQKLSLHIATNTKEKI